MHERLAAARKHAGYENAAEAAAALGVPYPTYAGHENGSSGFRADKGELYSRRFKVRFEWLMREIGPMFEPAASDPEDQLRSALLAFGVDLKLLSRAIGVIRSGFLKAEEQSERKMPDGPPASSNPHHAKEPST